MQPVSKFLVREGLTNSIAATLKADPLSEQIVHFLLENETAMDTARGIANWWVQRDELAVQASLDRLIACGVMTPHTFTSGILYGLTRNQEIRVWLRATYRPALNGDVPESTAVSLAEPAPVHAQPAVTGRQWAGFMAMVVGMFMAILFGLLAVDSFQQLQRIHHDRNRRDNGWERDPDIWGR